MADVTPPASQMNRTLAFSNDPYSTTSLHHSLDPTYSDSDGMQYFDFDAFGNDAHSQRQASQYDGHHAPDVDTSTEYGAFDETAYPLEPPMYDKDYDYAEEVMAHDQPTAPEDGETLEQDVSDDEDGAALRAALANYRNDNPMRSRLIPNPPENLDQEFAHPEEITQSGRSADLTTVTGDEKWHVDKESAEFLASVMKLISDHDLGEAIQRSTRNPLRELKLEEPILKSDPQMELIKLIERNEVHLASEGIDGCALDDEKDEGLRWPEKVRQLPGTLHGEIMKAKLEIDAETMEYLCDIHEEPKVDLDDWFKQDREKRDDFAASPSSPHRRQSKRANDLKVSSPLLPLEQSEEPPSKKVKMVCFSDELETLIPKLSDDDMIDMHEVVDEVSAALGPAIERADKSVQQRMLNEGLVEIDTTLRIPVPAIEDERPTPPCEIYAAGEGDSQRRLIHETYDSLPRSEIKWSGSSKSEQALQWGPFPLHLGKPKPEGDFDDGSLARYMSELDLIGDVDLERLTWKPDGLRVLDIDEVEDDELDTADFEGEVDIPNDEAVVRLPSVITIPPPAPSLRSVAPATTKDRPHHSQDWSSMDALLQKRKLQMQDGKKTTREESGLDMFARVQGFANAVAETTTSELLSNLQKPQPSARTPDAVEAAFANPTDTSYEVTFPAPAPDFQVSADPLQVVISFNLMQNHQFVRRLQKMLPAIDLIERDYTALPSETSKQSTHGRSSLEADITISPSTGLMFTNLQKLQQKPLPGQTSSFGIQEQIAVVATRFERLIVLVGDRPTMDDGQAPLHMMDANDSAAIADLINQTTVLETDVEVVYVAGGIDNLARWAAATISRNVVGDHRLLREETLWERFLRKAGMNAHAAQAVLAAMQPAPSASIPASDSSHTASSATTINSGLAKFVALGPEDRIQRFGPMMGGDRVLRRINRVLDAGWMSLS
ncbi:hypothetical protein M409DRAFT_58049 [Zasmidium cellare ATCC 36951]|uniref:Uncharacterized protein n=1 Tax=Zasmidium cellare ATCC 36951 TaxID=1080233 RepID=A0A6A6CAG1_ZASCE|nr:uncharacterized protein M409DRAFT_58049 [Zasmidium cellare ATCC 36951]KAF2162629.1 hypothetical protein M409DRAFT_58049 [Zasmidium cellare ATCC 36951]